MPRDYGNCGRGGVYNEQAPPDLPRKPTADVIDLIEREDKPYGFDWPGIGPPPRDYLDIAPAARRRTVGDGWET